MAVTLADITKLRKLSGAGMMDCKNALEEANNDIEGAMEILRKKGQAVAAKRSDRDASEGCVLVKAENGYGAIIALKCETDFVAKNVDFVKLATDILDAVVANKCKSLDEIKALPMGNGTVQDAVIARSGITGEKMELDGFSYIESDNISTYNHQGKNQLCTMVALNKAVAPEYGHAVAMQIAAMNPIAIDEARVPEDVKARELDVAIEKTKAEQVEKAVQNALRKAGFNLYISESEEHIAEGISKKEITPEQADEIRKIKTEVAEQKRANLPEQMIQNIARGRMAKFYKEVCLLEQEFIIDSKKTVGSYLKEADKDLTVTDFKRFTLRAE